MAVGLKLSGELAGLIGDVAVIAQGCAAGVDGSFEDEVNGGDEFFDAFGGNAIDALEGVEL